MALFSSTPKKTTKPASPAGRKAASTGASRAKQDVSGRLSDVIRFPWFSEKAFLGTEQGVYVFAVPPAATKYEVAAAIEKLYGVTPRKIRMVNLPAKKVSMRTRRGVGTRARRHKAYVYLKKGETIEFV